MIIGLCISLSQRWWTPQRWNNISFIFSYPAPTTVSCKYQRLATESYNSRFLPTVSKRVGGGARGAGRRVMWMTPMYGCYESLFPDRGKKRKNLSAVVDFSVHNCTLPAGKLRYMLQNQFPLAKGTEQIAKNSQGLRRRAKLSGAAHQQLLLIPCPFRPELPVLRLHAVPGPAIQNWCLLHAMVKNPRGGICFSD